MLHIKHAALKQKNVHLLIDSFEHIMWKTYHTEI